MGLTKAQREAKWEKYWRSSAHEPRLKLAALRLADAERERHMAIHAAAQDGLSVRKIAGVVGLSSSRVGQLLQVKPELEGVEGLNAPARVPLEEVYLRDRLLHEAALLRQGIAWLKEIAEGRTAAAFEGKKFVVVNLNTRAKGKYEPRVFDQERVLIMLERIAGDLDAWGRGHDMQIPTEELAQRRYDLAEPLEPEPPLDLDALRSTQQRIKGG